MNARTIISLALVALALPASAASAATRHAAPGGNGGEPCIRIAPCSLQNAVNAPSDEDTVVLLSGTYSVSSTITANKRISIVGEAGSRPRVEAAPGFNSAILNLYAGPGDRYEVRNLDMRSNSTALVVGAPARLSRLVLYGTGTNASTLALLGPGDMRVESVFAYANGQGANAITTTDGGSFLRNVTAIARGDNSRGLLAHGDCTTSPSPPYTCGQPYHTPTVDVKNTILDGEHLDIWATAVNASTPARVLIDHSNFDTFEEYGVGDVVDRGANQTAPAQFLPFWFFGFNYHQRTTSPTVDAGTNVILADSLGDEDIDGDDRVLGSAPDIGADELVPPVLDGGGTGGGTGSGSGTGSGGGGVVGDGGSTGDTVVPVVAGLGLAPSRFRAASSGASLASASGTRVSYGISEPARVTFTVQRARSGRRFGGRCVKPAKRNRGRRSCTRWVGVRGSFVHEARSETNRFRFSGRVGGKRLAPGRYRLVGRPADPAGNRGEVVRTAFRIVRR